MFVKLKLLHMLNTSTPPNVKLPIDGNSATLILLLKVVIMVCGIAIINIWPLADSIAARNIALALGATSSLILMLLSVRKLTIVRLLSLYFLLGLIFWVLLLYFFRPIAPENQWQEISGTWLRVALALLFGTGLGLTVSESKALRNLVLCGFFPLLVIQVWFYLHQSYSYGSLTPQFSPGIFITKAGGAYFLMWPFLLSCAYLNYFFSISSNNVQRSNMALKLGLCLLMFFVCFLAFYSIGSLNAILIACISTFVLIGSVTLKFILHGRHLFMGTVLVASFLVISALSLQTFSKQDQNKFYNLLHDFHIGTQIDRYTNWRNDTPQWVPDIPNSPPVNRSTYYRVASFINGTRLISEYPLGTGFTYLPYKYYMSRIYPGSTATHTHSGWIDFTLGVGIPGLLLCWFAIASAIWLAIKKHWRERKIGAPLNLWSYIVVWGLGGISILWVVAEVSEKEYIEHLMFMIAFLAAGNAPLSANKEKNIPV
jgi:hypothetical protein